MVVRTPLERVRGGLRLMGDGTDALNEHLM